VEEDPERNQCKRLFPIGCDARFFNPQGTRRRRCRRTRRDGDRRRELFALRGLPDEMKNHVRRNRSPGDRGIRINREFLIGTRDEVLRRR